MSTVQEYINQFKIDIPKYIMGAIGYSIDTNSLNAFSHADLMTIREKIINSTTYGNCFIDMFAVKYNLAKPVTSEENQRPNEFLGLSKIYLSYNIPESIAKGVFNEDRYKFILARFTNISSCFQGFYIVYPYASNGYIKDSLEIYGEFQIKGKEEIQPISISFWELAEDIYKQQNSFLGKSNCYFDYKYGRWYDDQIRFVGDCNLLENWKSLFQGYAKLKPIWDESLKNLKNKIDILISQKLNTLKSNTFLEFDKDKNGQLDLVDNDINKLLSAHQAKIVAVDKLYVQKFVKISNYLNQKRQNTQKIFEAIRNIESENELNELLDLLKDQIHTYELLLFNSLTMIGSLIDDDFITFFEIYECFDKLGVFNSNWENEVLNKLDNLNESIISLMYSIRDMESSITKSIGNLTFTTQESFNKLSFSIGKQLQNINSSINFNNLLTGIQTYQTYRINQNIKRRLN